MVTFGQLLRSWALKTTSISRDLQLDSRKYSGVGVLLKTAPDKYYLFCVSHRPVRETESLGLWMYFHRKPPLISECARIATDSISSLLEHFESTVVALRYIGQVRLIYQPRQLVSLLYSVGEKSSPTRFDFK